MKFISYGGETIALLLAQPNRKIHPDLELALPFTNITKALSARETRENFGRSSRYTLNYTPRFATAALSTEFRIGLTRLKNEPVACPLWDDAILLNASSAGATTIGKTATNPVRYGAEWLIVSPDFTTFEIVVVTAVSSGTLTISAPGTALNWPANTLAFPILFGRFEPRPSLTSITPSTVEGGLTILEDSTFARRINPFPGTIPIVGAGITSFASYALWNTSPNWSQVLDTTEVDIIYNLIGFLRQEQRQVYPQPVRRGLEMEFVCRSRDAIAAVERFFVDRRGPVRPFMIPTFRNDLELSQDLPIGGSPNLITIRASEYADADRPVHPGDPYFALVETGASGLEVAIDPQKITVVSGGNLTTQVAVGAHVAIKTRVSHLLLAHFAEPKIKWTYITPERAICRIKFIEVPDEYVTPNADAPERAYLFQFTEKTPTPQLSRFTSYENPLSYAGNSFAPAPFSFGTLKQKLDLKDECDLTSWGGNFPTNPIAKFFPYTLEGVLWCDIIQVNSQNPDDGTAKIIFTGKVTKPSFAGNDWRVVLRAFGDFMAGPANNFFFQKVCNVPLYSPKCGVSRAAFRYGATIISVDSTGTMLTCGPLGGAPDPTAQPDDFFAGGDMNIGPSAPGNYQTRTILHSSVAGGNVTLVLDRPLRVFGPGDTFNVWPGCNGGIETCIARFNNLVNFRGFPYIPLRNPSANIGQVAATTGGKKG